MYWECPRSDSNALSRLMILARALGWPPADHSTSVKFRAQIDLIHRPAVMSRFFPAPDSDNYGFYIVGNGNDKPFSVLAVDAVPDLSLWGSGQGQFFPRYTYATPTAGEDLFSAAERPQPLVT